LLKYPEILVHLKLYFSRLGDIICDNTDLFRVRDNVFKGGNLDLPCGEHNQLDLTLFCD